MVRRNACIGAFLLLGSVASLIAETLDLPPRPSDAMTGTEAVAILTPLSLADREELILSEISRGNVPDFLRRMVPVTVGEDEHRAMYWVAPDYLALGSNEDYFLAPMTPVLAQRIASLLDCTLPTRKMVNQIWSQAPVKLEPTPIPPGPAMTSVRVFAEHNAAVRAQREAAEETHPLGSLVAGSKKDVVISRRITGPFVNPRVERPVVIYGWHRPDGSPIQPLYNGHGETYADYSHGIRLVRNTMTVDGDETAVAKVLKSPVFAYLLSDEGPLSCPRYR